MSIQTTSDNVQPYIINWQDNIDLPEKIINNIKNKYLQETIKYNTGISSGNICCTDYNAWISFYPKTTITNTRLFHALKSHTEPFYVNRKIINISINKNFYNRHGFPNKEDKDET
jgi:hypothetical protein